MMFAPTSPGQRQLTQSRHLRDDRHNDGLEEEEDTCRRHLRDDRHNDGAVF
jgi:hypothetical protein